MSETSKIEAILLLIGDVVIFIVALWLALTLRHLEIPSQELFNQHLVPFSYLFAVWVLVYFIAGLYDNHITFFKQRLPGIIFRAQIFNIVFAALFFFLIPYFTITPKTNLVIYLVTSFGLIVAWRLVIAQLIGVRKVKNALLIAEGPEAQELIKEVEAHTARYGFVFTHVFSPKDIVTTPSLQEQILEFVDQRNISVVVADTRDANMQTLIPVFYNLTYLHASFSFVDFVKMYEQVFQRMPVSTLTPMWFMEHITLGPRPAYDLFKRMFDIVAGLVVCFVTLLATPFVWFLIWLDDKGPLFVVQERIGKHNQPIKIMKFRTMTGSDSGNEVLRSNLRVTRPGQFLRSSRIDELPQGLNLLRGDISVVGPRPEFPPLVAEYASAIPYYNARHFIKPGLTGWAQIYHQAHPHHGVDVDETKNKLSYDLYYVKNRSLILDLVISLKTIKTLLSRVGR